MSDNPVQTLESCLCCMRLNRGSSTVNALNKGDVLMGHNEMKAAQTHGFSALRISENHVRCSLIVRVDDLQGLH